MFNKRKNWFGITCLNLTDLNFLGNYVVNVLGELNFLYNSDWIRLKEDSHIHLGCFEGE